MRYVVDADVVLALFLQDREQVQARELNEARAEIERTIPDTYVDVTKNCLIRAVNQYPDLFYFGDYTISRKRELTPVEVVYFKMHLWTAISAEVEAAIEKVKHAANPA